MPNAASARSNGTAPLTPRQAAFCRLLAEGRSNRDAYLQAGYSVTSNEVADVNASRLLSNAKVAAMVRALQAQAARKVEVTVEGQYRKLEEARKRAAKDGAHAAVIQAISVQNKLFGLEKSATEATVRMASRSPDAPQEIELSVEEWHRQQSGLLLGSGMSDMSGNKGENVVDDGTASGPPAVSPSVRAASARDAEGARRLAEWRAGVTIGADEHDRDEPDDDLRLG